MIVNWKS